jgi:hypothetical protein
VYPVGDRSFTHKEHEMAKTAARTDYELAIERLGDAIEALDEVQTLFAGEPGMAPDFWVGIIFTAQSSLATVAEMAEEVEKMRAKSLKRRKRRASTLAAR